MKTMVYKLLIVALFFNINSYGKIGNKFDSDSIIFSLISECNFIVKFLPNNQTKVIIDGKKIPGTLKKIKGAKNHYNFYKNDSIIFTLGFNEGYFIVNQNYEHKCESSKAIMMVQKGDQENKRLFDDYIKYTESVFSNPEKLNNKAFFLEKEGVYYEAKMILIEIIKKFPDRTVAYINLGDAYWGLEDQTKAKEAYKKYIDLMKESGKEVKIPKRVYDRVR